MATPIYLSLVFHNHQPVGQFDYVNEHVTHVSYVPLVELLERHPAVCAAIHFSGHLLRWLSDTNHELIDRLRVLIQRGQVEILTGGYYEPIMVAIPDDDKIGQIGQLTQALSGYFGATPSGAWLAERVWEPSLPRALSMAGVKYIILDDVQFESVRLDQSDDLFGYFVTEEQGHTLAAFPSHTWLNDMPWVAIDTVIERFRALSDEQTPKYPQKLVLIAQDGEKFGTWPGTYERCWGDGKYMENLFTALEKNSSWLKLITPAEYIKRFPPMGRTYISSTSEPDMGEWSLGPDAARIFHSLKATAQTRQRTDLLPFVRGGAWRNFLVRYDEINHLQKRLLLTSAKVHAMRRGRKRDEALDLLWAAEAGDTFWHGLYGGIYLFKLRAAAYANLIAAEALADGEHSELTLTTHDFDADGRADVLLNMEPFNAVWLAGVGGVMAELDYKPASFNLLNIMSRHKEAYHDELRSAAAEGRIITPDQPGYTDLDSAVAANIVRAKETGLESILVYDWHRRASFVDHFLRDETTFTEFFHAQYAEQGDFVNLPYRAELRQNPRFARIALTRDGHVWIGSKHHPVTVMKVFAFEKDAPFYTATYILSHPSPAPITLRFAVEMALGFDGGDNEQFCGLTLNGNPASWPLNRLAVYPAAHSYCAADTLRGLAVTTELSEAATVWAFPLESVTLSETGYERGYQGTVFLNIWSVTVPPDATWTVTITQRLQPLNREPDRP